MSDFSNRFYSSRTVITAAIAFAIAAAVYVHTMVYGVCFLDTGEFQTATYVLGITHPTGYPLFTIAGKIFGTLVPIGEWAFRMNLMSVVCVAASVAMLAIVAIRFGASPAVALAAALTFGFALNVWKTSGHADPYTLTLIIGAALWVLAFKWADTGERKWLWLLALGSGVGLGSAAVLVMEVPALVIFALISRPRDFLRPSAMIVAGLLGIFGGTAIYAWLPLRARMNPPLNYGNPRTWASFRAVALGAGVGETKDFLTWHGPIDSIRNLPIVLHWHGDWLTPTGATLVGCFALIGLAVLVWRNWRTGLGIILGILIPSYAASVWWANDIGNYFLIPNWLTLIAAAVGVQTAMIGPLKRLGSNLVFRPLSAIAVLAIFAIPYHVYRVNSNHSDVTGMRGYRDGDIAIAKVFSTVKPHAVIFSWWGPSTALWYGKYVEGLRPDVDVIDDTNLAAHGWTDATEGMAYYFGKRPIYTTPAGDEYDRYSKRFHMHVASDLGVFGQALYEVDGKIDLTRREFGNGHVFVLTTPLVAKATELEMRRSPSSRPQQLAIADLMTYGGAKPKIAAPDGWNLIREDSSMTTRQSLYWHIIQRNEPDSYTWKFSQPGETQGAILVFDRAADAEPVDGASGTTGEGWQMIAPAVATTHSDDFSVVFFATDFHGADPGHDRPPNMVPLVENDEPSHPYWIFGAANAGKDTLGPVQCKSGQTFHWASAHVAIRRDGSANR